MMGEEEDLGVVDGLAGLIPADDDVLHVVVEDLGGHALEIAKGPDVPVKEALECRPLYELGIGGAAVTQDEHEDEDRRRPARGPFDLEVGPVELGLMARLGLESRVGQPRLAILDRPDIPLHGLVAARIAPALEPIPDPGGLVVVLAEKVLDRLMIRGEDGLPHRGLAIAGEIVALEMLLHGLPVQSQLFSDGSEAFPAPAHSLDVHEYLLGDHAVSPPFDERTIPPLQSPGGTLFMTRIGTLFYDHRQPHSPPNLVPFSPAPTGITPRLNPATYRYYDRPASICSDRQQF